LQRAVPTGDDSDDGIIQENDEQRKNVRWAMTDLATLIVTDGKTKRAKKGRTGAEKPFYASGKNCPRCPRGERRSVQYHCPILNFSPKVRNPIPPCMERNICGTVERGPPIGPWVNPSWTKMRVWHSLKTPMDQLGSTDQSNAKSPILWQQKLLELECLSLMGSNMRLSTMKLSFIR
jgi:hypothetical protein